MGAGNVCEALCKELGGCLISRSGSSLLAGPGCHCPGHSACFCLEPWGTHAFISGPTGLASSPTPPGPKSKSRAWGLERAEIREGERMKGEALHLEGLNDAGLEHRDTQAGRTCVCVCVSC